ncbi:tetratricopeptide repeat protein [Pyxidicoccus fallax]|uniref:Tetratricopeptide repeat protein n=1 Tax=Pyxidicoccus fallax TaxID=394095 RepID=A0A848LJ11_9BACT|nr:tetratricopeptide repeat protein [Pyxidicoccus fallax]NMO17666.1 tetratricopeptide repeat protein [Pyxidicoccus fallax]NPC78646.1 tetratricopeptide repeat protein [Pyxidicoccus fallax]
MTTQSMQALLKAGEVDKARELAESALSKNKDDRVALLTLAKLASVDGDWDRAEQLVNQATRGGVEDADSKLVKAALASSRGDLEGARTLYTQIIREAKPPRAEAHFGLSFILGGLNDFPGARKELERAVQLDPDVAQYRFNLARVLLAQEELTLALPHLQRALELNPLNPPVYVTWTIILQQLGELAQAEDLLRDGLKLMPDQPELLNALSRVLAARGNVPEAFGIAKHLAREFPDDPEAQGNLARMMMATGHRVEALELVRKLEARGQATAQTKSIEAMVLEAGAPPDVEGAVHAWRAAMDLDPEDWAPANNLGNLLMRWEEGGDPEERLTAAIEILEESRRRAPHRVEPVLNLAIVHARKGDKTKAQAMAREVLKLAPADAKELREQAERLLQTVR